MNIESTHNKAIIILHEIYGLNEHMKYQQNRYAQLGFDIVMPNMLGRDPFTYEQVQDAYTYYKESVGFDAYNQITHLVHQLKRTYKKVYIVGFSVGATIAWRCSEDVFCDGVIACYGSRIRDYLKVNPRCPTLLLFADRDSFSVTEVVESLVHKDDITIEIYNAEHGFMDPYSKNFNGVRAKEAEARIISFLNSISRPH